MRGFVARSEGRAGTIPYLREIVTGHYGIFFPI